MTNDSKVKMSNQEHMSRKENFILINRHRFLNKNNRKRLKGEKKDYDDYEELKIQTHTLRPDGPEYVCLEYVQHKKDDGSVFVLSVINYVKGLNDNLVRKKSYIFVHRTQTEMDLISFEQGEKPKNLNIEFKKRFSTKL